MCKRIILLFSILSFLSVIGFAQQGEGVNQTDANGKKQGEWKTYYGLPQGGGLKYVGHFIDGKPIGQFKFYFKSGAVKSITNYGKNGSAKCEVFYETGELAVKGNYKHEEKDSTWLFFYPGGKLMAVKHYSLGKKVGTWLNYYDDGKSIVRKKQYENGLETGYEYFYMKNGQMTIKRDYDKGKLNGPAYFYYPDGKIHVKGIYKNDFKNGKWYFYNPTGDSVKTAIYINSVLKGGPKVYPPDTVHLDPQKILQEEDSKFGMSPDGQNY